MSGEVILVTSLKGGCGKSTVCAGLAYALSLKGKRTLALSLDAYNTSLDMLLGADSMLFDISDHPEKSLSEICIPVDGCEGLSLAVSMPFSKKDSDVTAFIEAAKRSGNYDFILIDKGFDSLPALLSLADISDKVLIVSTQISDSLRSAELLACLLDDNGNCGDKAELVLNSFYTDPAAVDCFSGINVIITETKLPLLGIVPFSDEMHVGQAAIKNIKDSLPHNAFSNIAGRILGEDIRILDFLPAKNRRLILNNGCSGGNKI